MVTNPDETDAVLLDAVRAEVAAVGAGRITVAGVARRAGLSRMTVYRRSGNVQQLVLDAIAAEFAAVISSADAVGGAGRARIVAVGLHVVRALRESALLQKLQRDDPDLLLPYLLDHFGRGQLTLVHRLSVLIADGQQEGGVRPGDPELLARMLIMALQAFVFAPDMIDADRGSASLRPQVDREIGHLIDSYLAPDET